MGDVTLYLEEMAGGNRASENRLVEAIYRELHQLASGIMRRERAGHTLQATALVNEAYLRLVGNRQISWESRAHFLNAAAKTMRRVLIDHARGIQAGKRKGDAKQVVLEENMAISCDDPELLLSIESALTRLAELDPRQARVVELRYFGGLSVDETAQIIGASPKTVKRDWAMARVWLESQLRPVVSPSCLSKTPNAGSA